MNSYTKINAWETSSHLSTFISPLPRKFLVVSIAPTFQGGRLQDCTNSRIPSRKLRRPVFTPCHWPCICREESDWKHGTSWNSQQNDQPKPNKNTSLSPWYQHLRCVKQTWTRMPHSFQDMPGGQHCQPILSVLHQIITVPYESEIESVFWKPGLRSKTLHAMLNLLNLLSSFFVVWAEKLQQDPAMHFSPWFCCPPCAPPLQQSNCV